MYATDIYTGGTGSIDSLVLMDGIDVSVDNSDIEVLVDQQAIEVKVDNTAVDAVVTNDLIDVTIDDSPIEVILPSDQINVAICGCTIVITDEEVMQKIAGDNVGGHRMVTVNPDGEIIHADSDLILDGKQVIGMTLQAALVDTWCSIAINGDEVTEPSWSWDTTKSIFLGDNGLLTQTAPTEGFVLIVAVPLTAQSIRIRVEMPIFL